MCGIGGVWCFGKERLDESDVTKIVELAEYLETRGTDAFGFYNGERVIKFPSRASEVIEMIDQIRPFEELISGKRMFLMHTRASTGADPLRNKNNHPFESKDLVMAHNGVMYYDVHYVIKGTKVINAKYYYEELDPYEIFGELNEDIPETDSFQILVELQRSYNKYKDFKDALILALDDLACLGDMALWIYSKREDKLALFRYERPLFMGYKDNKLWFASEEWMLKRIGIKSIKPIRDGELLVFNKEKRELWEFIDTSRNWGDDLRVYDYYEDESRNARRVLRGFKDYWDWREFYF